MMTRSLRLQHLVMALAAWAATGARAAPDTAADEARISRERAQAEAEFAREERECRARFAVTDCVAEARSRRRERLADLHRQEVSINDAKRLQHAVDRARTVDERSSAERQQADAERRARVLKDDQDRQQRAAERAAARRDAASAATGQSHDAKAPSQGVKPRAPGNAGEFRKKQEEAAAHKADVQKRLAEKPSQKPPLPTPP